MFTTILHHINEYRIYQATTVQKKGRHYIIMQ